MPDEVKFSELSLITTIPGTAVIPLLSDGVSVGTQWSDLAKVWEAGTDLASASTLAVLANGGYFHVTGTTTITALSQSSNLRAGRLIQLKFNGILTLTHNATSLILPGGANITTAAGDVATFRCDDSANNYWRCVQYQRASGGGLKAPTAQLFTSSGTYTPSPGCIKIFVEVQAGGSGGMYALGGSSQADCGGGGAAGGYGAAWMVPGLGSSVTVGAGGNGGIQSSSTAPTAGGDSTAYGTLSATGGGNQALNLGAGTALGIARGAIGGTASGGDANIGGQSGGVGVRLSGTVSYGGLGGQSVLGGCREVKVNSANGVAGVGYGPGGAGGNALTATGRDGGNGGPGLVRITEFY